ncbi:MAG: hypothetical protein H7343_08855 [Undibacterium sp.]|nr:hypothetical protein [Opitutaceae bacterium]
MEQIAQLRALGHGHIGAAQHFRGDGDAEDLAVEIVDGLVDERGAATLDLVDASQRPLEVAHPTGSLRLLHTFIFRVAFANRLIDEIDHLAVRLDQRSGCKLEPGGRENMHFFEEADLEQAPFEHEFLQPVALLPAVQSVFHLFFFRVDIGRPGGGSARARAQLAFKRIEHLRNMVVELPTREGTSRGVTGIGIGGVPPSH